MPGGGADVVLQLERDFMTERHYIVPLSVGSDFILEMLPRIGVSESSITAAARDNLAAHGLVADIGRNRYRLQNLHVRGQEVPEIVVVVEDLDPDFAFDGILGYNFFRNFSGASYEPASRRFILVDP